MEKERPAATPFDLVVVTAICFGVFIFESVTAALHGLPDYHLSDQNLGGLIVLEAGAATLALAFLRVRGRDLRALVFSPSFRGMLTGTGLYLLTVLLSVPAQALLAQVVPALGEAQSTLRPVALSVPMILAVSLVNGLYEEVFLLGFLQAGMRRYGGETALLTVLLVRTSYHLYQGPGGTLFAATFGAVVGYYYLKTGKLWPAIFAHMTGDAIGLAVV